MYDILIRPARAAFVLIDDTCFTVFKANAEGDDGKFVVIMEDAHGDRKMSCYDKHDIGRFPWSGGVIKLLNDKSV